MTSIRACSSRTLLALLFLVGSLLTVAPASAHTDLVRGDPQADTTVGPLTRVQLEFASPVLPELAEVEVLDAAGVDHVSGESSTFGTKVVTPVRSVDGSGRYEVRYRMVAVDGHPVVGSYHFSVSAASAPAVERSSAGSGLAADAQAPGGAPPWLVPLLAVLAVVVIAGARVLQLRRAGR
jgi:methionine-rich copper-binding protein CopC